MRSLERLCIAGFAFAFLPVLVVPIMLLVDFGDDPLNILALWLPCVLFFVWLAVLLLWINRGRSAGRVSRRRAIENAVIPWALGLVALLLQAWLFTRP